MRLNFLCPRHKEQLTTFPHQARDFWRRCLGQLSSEALVATPTQVSMAGSSLQAAGLYFDEADDLTDEDAQDYAESALVLIRLLVKLDQRRLATVVLVGSTAKLEQTMEKGVSRDAVTFARRCLTIEGGECVNDDPRSSRPRPAATSVTLLRPAVTMH
ncbi:MAG: hypothetical protein AAGG55_10845 [Pseudomonadota bacterium]